MTRRRRRRVRTQEGEEQQGGAAVARRGSRDRSPAPKGRREEGGRRSPLTTAVDENRAPSSPFCLLSCSALAPFEEGALGALADAPGRGSGRMSSGPSPTISQPSRRAWRWPSRRTLPPTSPRRSRPSPHRPKVRHPVDDAGRGRALRLDESAVLPIRVRAAVGGRARRGRGGERAVERVPARPPRAKARWSKGMPSVQSHSPFR